MLQQLLIPPLSSIEQVLSLWEDKRGELWKLCVGFSQTAIRNVFASHRIKYLHNMDTLKDRTSMTVKKISFVGRIAKRRWTRRNSDVSLWVILALPVVRLTAGRGRWRRPWMCTICEVMMDARNAKGTLTHHWSPPHWGRTWNSWAKNMTKIKTSETSFSSLSFSFPFPFPLSFSLFLPFHFLLSSGYWALNAKLLNLVPSKILKNPVYLTAFSS